MDTGTDVVKRGFARMVKGGVIMDVVNAVQAKIAEKAGAVAVMALEMVPADIRAAGGVARMADPEIITQIEHAVTIPVMAKVRIGHFAEAQLLQTLNIDMIDESEVLTPADEENHIDKRKFTTPFVCGARDLGEALRRLNEGAAMIRTKGEAGSGNIVEAVRHLRKINSQIRELEKNEHNKGFLEKKSDEYRAPLSLIKEVAKIGRLPVVNFAAGGISTPADVSLVMQLGCDGVFVGSGIFKSQHPTKTAKAIVLAADNYLKPDVLAKVSRGMGKSMKGIDTRHLPKEHKLQERGTD